MCFHVDLNNPNKLKADKNIECYKLLVKADNKYFSYYRNHEYKLNEVMMSPLELPFEPPYGTIDSNRIIEKGLHSYSNDTNFYTDYILSKSKEDYNDRDVVLLKAYIPKNAEYYYNRHSHEYVSDRLVVTSEEKTLKL